MSEISLTLVLQIKTSRIINDMAKVQQKSEEITAFGGIFFVLDKFDRILSSVIDSHLGLRSRLIGYQYSEITRAVFSVFCCGGTCMEDLNLYLKDTLTERPQTRVPNAATVLRGIEELATENCRSWPSSLESRPRTGSRASCSDSSPCRPSGSERQGSTNSTSTPISHTNLFGNTDKTKSFVDTSVYASRPYGVRGN